MADTSSWLYVVPRRRYHKETHRLDTHNDIKRRLLREVVQDNLAMYPAVPPPHPAAHRVWAVVGKMLLVAVAMVLLPVDNMSTVISTVIQPQSEIPIATGIEALSEVPISTVIAPPSETPQLALVTAPSSEAPPQADESAPEQGVAALEPPHIEVPPLTLEEPFPTSEDVGSAEPTFLTPAPIDLAVLPLEVRKIVVDPGHGGKDIGTSTPGGLAEKEVTLDIGLRLRRLLEQAAFEVVMTRDKDEAVPLRQRIALANAQSADLFVSIHLNWIDGGQVRGMETYYLGPTEDPVLLQLAARENRDSGYSLADFRKLLDHIYLSMRRDESRRLAESVQRTLVTTLRRKRPALVNRGVKTAPFAVLVDTEMPAILAEVACLSHPEEAHLLATPQYRQDIAQALLEGIRAYAQALNRFPKISQERKLTHE
jgi:N-acetylmuramoyl-L-alanine amidase